MLKKSALFFSVILHPLLLPTLGVLILLYSGTYLQVLPFSAKKLLLLLTFSGTCLFPAITISFIFMRGLISDIQISDHNQRILPLSLALIFYLMTFIFFLSLPVYRFMRGFMLASLLEVLFVLLLNFRWKISIHMAGMGGFIAFLLATSVYHDLHLFGYIIAAIFAAGAAGTSRLILGVHTMSQIISGFILGTIVMAACLWIFLM